MKHRTHFFAAALVFSFAALLMAAGASAATVRVAITGSVQTTAMVGGDPSIGISLAGVAGDLTYTGIGTSTGTLTETYPSAPIFTGMSGPGAALSVFHGDVSQGCVRIQGKQAIVIGHLAAGEQFDVLFPAPAPPVLHHYEWVGTFLEDNGAGADRGVSVFFQTGMTACNASNNNIWTNTVAPNLTPPNGALDSGDVSFGYMDLRNTTTPDEMDTDVSVTDPNGLSVTITDAPDTNPLPADRGLQAVVGSGSGKATLKACGQDVKLLHGSTAIFTCASLITHVVTGSAEIPLPDGTVVTVPEGAAVEVADNADGGVTIDNIGTVPITVTSDGVTGTIGPGETVRSWDFQGFFGPVDSPTVMNQVKAGAAVPLKWRLLNGSNAPVTDLSTASITVTTLGCATGETVDQIEETAAGGSGLQNLGNGYYQLNWKTPTSYARSCKTLHLDIGDGVTHDAFFQFTK